MGSDGWLPVSAAAACGLIGCNSADAHAADHACGCGWLVAGLTTWRVVFRDNDPDSLSVCRSIAPGPWRGHGLSSGRVFPSCAQGDAAEYKNKQGSEFAPPPPVVKMWFEGGGGGGRFVFFLRNLQKSSVTIEDGRGLPDDAPYRDGVTCGSPVGQSGSSSTGLERPSCSAVKVKVRRGSVWFVGYGNQQATPDPPVVCLYNRWTPDPPVVCLYNRRATGREVTGVEVVRLSQTAQLSLHSSAASVCSSFFVAESERDTHIQKTFVMLERFIIYQ